MQSENQGFSLQTTPCKAVNSITVNTALSPNLICQLPTAVVVNYEFC